MRNQDKYNIDNVREKLFQDGFELCEDKYISAKTPMVCIDSDGYYVNIIWSNYLTRHSIGKRFSSTNINTIKNINHYLELNNCHFICISDKYVSSTNDELLFQCTICGEIIKRKWRDVNKTDNPNRHHILCPNCDGRTESIHALVLKQMFKYNYPDSEEEDKSFRNPITGKICPTDIVNHRLKIAIEVQSQWHDFEDTKIKDKFKREYWINRGYKFYDPDIRDYTVLQMCQLFFDIDELPDYIDYNYSNKINIKQIQDMLNQYMSISSIASKLNINIHRIYDALYSNKLKRPVGYINADLKPIVQLDKNGVLVGEYNSISEAAKINGFNKGTLTSSFTRETHYSQGYYWFDKEKYYSGDYKIIERPDMKFEISVDKYDLKNNYICSYDTIKEAAKELNVSNTDIYRVAIGKQNYIKGYIFKLAS